MGKMIPARSAVPETPPEPKPMPKTTELTEGPKVNSTGSYEPATYRTRTGSIRTDN